MTHQNQYEPPNYVLKALRKGPLRPSDWRPLAASRESMVATIHYLKKRKGLPIVAVRKPGTGKRGPVIEYRLEE